MSAKIMIEVDAKHEAIFPPPIISRSKFSAVSASRFLRMRYFSSRRRF
jgi:hypothetical protein